MVPEQYEQSCSLYYYFTTTNNKHTSTRIARMAHEMYRDASAIEVEPYQREMRSRGASRGAPAADGAGAVEDPALGGEEDLVRRRLLQLLLRPPEKRWGWSVRAGSPSAPVVVVAVLRPPEMHQRGRRGGRERQLGWEAGGARADLRDGREVPRFSETQWAIRWAREQCAQRPIYRGGDGMGSPLESV